ncbi:MAG: DUF4255 domain-containing protein [Myxococcota bacterium]
MTRTLVRLVAESIKASPIWPPAQLPNVSGLPPDQLTGDDAVGIYLYHLAEDPSYRNQDWSGRPLSPVRYSPLALNLHYVVSAHSEQLNDEAPAREQLLMGLAVKALRDHAIINDGTSVGGVPILEPALLGSDNLLRISPQPVQPNEAVNYWTAGSKPLRLSAYYEVRVVLMEPQEPPAGGGRVFSYGVHTFLSGPPHLDTSRNRVTFQLPSETTPRSVDLQPAQAAPGDEVTFLGRDLGGGPLDLLVRASTWPEPLIADANWGVVGSGDRVFATVRSTLDGTAVLPGTYTAAAEVRKTLTLPDGSTRDIRQRSNITPFVITPGIDSIGPIVNDVFVVTGSTFQHPELGPGTVRAYLGADELQAGVQGSLNPGEFAIVDATTLELRLPGSAVVGVPLLLRIRVNDSNSPPRWVVP